MNITEQKPKDLSAPVSAPESAPAAADKKDQTNAEKKKEENPAPVKPEETQALKNGPTTPCLSIKEVADRKKVFIGEKEYYVVSLEEIEKYRELKDSYKDDAMSTFILYMHSEFVKDLVHMRRSGKLKNVAKSVAGGFILIIILILIVVIIFSIMKLANKSS